MTDITELAQSLKAAANTTSDAIDRLKAFPGDELIDLSQHEGEQVDIDITMINEWYELSSPANILALLEAQEKAQQRIAVLDAELKREREKSRRVMSRISALESRTVTVKLPLPRRKTADDYVDDTFEPCDLAAVYNACRLECEVKFKNALTAAGIKVEAE